MSAAPPPPRPAAGDLHFAAVDVGTASVRAGIFDSAGRLLDRCTAPISMRRGDDGRIEHRSEEIWAAACEALRNVRRGLGLRPDRIGGLAFGATCSLVLRDAGGAPLPATEGGPPEWDVISWCDHRAAGEAAEAAPEIARLAAAGLGPALSESGFASPEMQPPRAMRFKRRRRGEWAGLVPVDLPDFMVWRATGTLRRGTSSLSLKWGWDPEHPQGWSPALLAALGLEDMPDKLLPPGAPPPAAPGVCAGRLCAAAAEAMGFAPGCAVAAGQVDAFAGAVGLMGDLSDAALPGAAALIAGTSSCVLQLQPDRGPAPGLWGPSRDAALPGWWAVEGGQSAAGALLDHMLRIGGAGEPDQALHEKVAARVACGLAAEGMGYGAGIHVLPDFNGIRALNPDPDAFGAVMGMSLERSFDAACRLWWRAAVSLALGVAELTAHLSARGAPITRLHLGGGHGRSPLLSQLYADATGLPVACGGPGGGMLRGAALAAMTASGAYPSLQAAARAAPPERRILLPDPARTAPLARDRQALAELAACRARLRALS